TNAGYLEFGVTFSFPVTSLDANAFTLTKTGTADGTLGPPYFSGSIWKVPVNAVNGDGTLRLDLTDTTGVTPNASSTFTAGQIYVVDNTGPGISEVSSTTENGIYTAGDVIDIQVTFTD